MVQERREPELVPQEQGELSSQKPRSLPWTCHPQGQEPQGQEPQAQQPQA